MSFLALVIVATPFAAVTLIGVFAGGGDGWIHVVENRLVREAGNTLLLMLLSGVLMLLLGVSLAWFVSMYRFPGRTVIEWLVVLPLAAPGYVLAFAYLELFSVSGPLQSTLRELTGWSARDYWFPDMASLPGLAFVLALTLYPYVYLAARVAFVTQSECTMEAARTLGASPSERFFKVALPAARPAIVAGLALALMEVAAEYGASVHFGVQTLTVGLFSTWKGFGDAALACRLALVLLVIVLGLLWLERSQRGRSGTANTSIRIRPTSHACLPVMGVVGVYALVCAVLSAGLILPMARFVWIAIETGDRTAPFMDAVVNTLMLASVGTVVALVFAWVLTMTAERRSPLGYLSRWIPATGYAIPGAVLGLGALAVMGWANQSGLTDGTSVVMALFALTWIYVCRFVAAGAGSIGTALARYGVSTRQASTVFAISGARRFSEVEFPLARTGVFAGALIVFVEILKELPGTLLLRPFDWDTLAVRAYTYASDERLGSAAIPSLLITLAGLIPVILLSHGLSRSRPTGR